LKNFTGLPTNQYAPIMQTIANVGPMAVAVDASSWGSYKVEYSMDAIKQILTLIILFN